MPNVSRVVILKNVGILKDYLYESPFDQADKAPDRAKEEQMRLAQIAEQKKLDEIEQEKQLMQQRLYTQYGGA